MFGFYTYKKSIFAFCIYRNQCAIVSPFDKEKSSWFSVWDFHDNGY